MRIAKWRRFGYLWVMLNPSLPTLPIINGQPVLFAIYGNPSDGKVDIMTANGINRKALIGMIFNALSMLLQKSVIEAPRVEEPQIIDIGSSGNVA